jgi:hypothetical protein
MGQVLYLLRSAPDQAVFDLISAIGAGEATVVCLYPDAVTATPVDWSRVLDDIFTHDKVICWW